MKHLRDFLVFMAVFFFMEGNLWAQNDLSSLMRERNEYYFNLAIEKPAEIQAISEICSIDGFKDKTVVCYANQQQYDRLIQAGYQPDLQTPPSLREEAKMWDGRATYAWDSYPTYSQYESMMQAFPTSTVSGRTCTYMELGTLSSGRKIMGVRINNGSPDGKPKFLYSSTIHGDETTGMILMLRLIDELCTSTDSRVVNLVNNLDIFIFPDANPDGTYYGGNNTVTGSRRANANGVDMNRNYPDPHGSAHPDGNAYQTETQWFMTLAETYPFVMGANFHGGAEVMNYPWDNTYTRHADDAWWQYISNEYVANARAVYSGYMTDTYSSGITNGADWYMIGGGRQDYMNGYCQCREITIECSSTKTLPAAQLNSYWNYNHNAMLAYMEQCINGVHGFVYDATTNQPLNGVTVTVQDHDDEYSVVSTHTAGDFHRPIKGGTYTFAFEKDGYCPQFVEVTVADGQRAELNNIQLTSGSCMVPNFTASTTDVSLGQSISFTDASYGDVVSWSWTFEGATPSTSTAQNPTGITYSTAGDYDVTLVITDAEGFSDTLTKENYIHVAETITMQNGTVTTCSGIFYDSGGANSNYGNNLTYTMTFYPETEGAMMSVTFSQFDTESNYDYLYIYDGTSTSATQIGQYSGTTSPGTVTATNVAGALTFKFTSDSGVNNSGWVATVSCIIPEWTITATANLVEAGTIEGAGTYTAGEICTLIATAAEDYQFLQWTENGTVVSTDATYSFQVTADRDLMAVFTSTIPVNITVNASPARAGLVSGGGEYLIGETCTVTATPNTGYSFTNWTENGTVVSENPEYSFMVSIDRDLVANFSFEATEPKDCYFSVNTIAAGSYVMGYLNGSTLNMLTRNNNTVAATTATVTPTDYGFSVEEGTNLSQVTLQAYGNNGQYYIKYTYNSYTYYLARSNYGGNLSWTNSTNSSSARWYIKDNGIYVAVTSGGGMGGSGSTTNYYLYYDNGFKLSTTQQNNITFYSEGECPAVPSFTITATAEPAEGGIVEGADIYFLGETCVLTATANEGYQFVNWTEDGMEVSTETSYMFEATADRDLVANFAEVATTVEQVVTLHAGWNWWSTYLEIDLEDLENALDANGIVIKSQSEFISYSPQFGMWVGGIDAIFPEQMYKIYVSQSCSFTLSGSAVNPAVHPITIRPNSNWIGCPIQQSMTLEEAFVNFSPSNGDVIRSSNGFSTYSSIMGWIGDVETLEPGKGYLYCSKASVNKTLVFP